jgi:hypothetical protein
MKIDGGVPGNDLRSVAKVARELENLGYSGAFSAEASVVPR